VTNVCCLISLDQQAAYAASAYRRRLLDKRRDLLKPVRRWVPLPAPLPHSLSGGTISLGSDLSVPTWTADETWRRPEGDVACRICSCNDGAYAGSYLYGATRTRGPALTGDSGGAYWRRRILLSGAGGGTRYRCLCGGA